MMSHLDPKKGSSNAAPCLRSKRSPPEEVRKTLSEAVTGFSIRANNEAWCAAHLHMLCNKAISAYLKYNTSVSTGQHRALLINYESLPGIIPKVILPYLFHTNINNNWLTKMIAESKHYSKSRGSRFRLFFSDSQDKDSRATTEIQTYADKILSSSYSQLNDLALRGFHAVASSLVDNLQVVKSSNDNQLSYQWNSLKEFPDSSFTEHHHLYDHNSPLSSSSSSLVSVPVVISSSYLPSKPLEKDEIPHSETLKRFDFVPWAPFANHHNSKTFFKPNCPAIPEPGYPKHFSMLDLLKNWNSDNTEIPPYHYDSLCHFNYLNVTEVQIALRYREIEVPFVMYNIPEVDDVVKKWNNLDYLSSKLGSKAYRTETSTSNHFMYWRHVGGSFLRGNKNWKPPTSVISTKFEQWLELAIKGQNKTLEDRQHQYFRVSSDAGNDWLYKELPFFQPKKSVFIVNPKDQRGIHCRFGMRSVIAESHWDGSRNAVVMLGGMRRWILAHPENCKNVHMLPQSHPSARHSEVDWSQPDVKRFPNFAKAMGNEVILTPGDYLFVPTHWLHYIVSLNVNFQCNTRSGVYPGYSKFIKECGF
jgi:hypothetical protein